MHLTGSMYLTRAESPDPGLALQRRSGGSLGYPLGRVPTRESGHRHPHVPRPTRGPPYPGVECLAWYIHQRTHELDQQNDLDRARLGLHVQLGFNLADPARTDSGKSIKFTRS